MKNHAMHWEGREYWAGTSQHESMHSGIISMTTVTVQMKPANHINATIRLQPKQCHKMPVAVTFTADCDRRLSLNY